MSDWEPFEELEHTADLALRVRGRDLRELVTNACRGVIHLIGDTTGEAPTNWVPVSASGPDEERLLLRFVKELLYVWDLHGGLPVAVEVELAEEPGSLTGRIGFAHPDDLEDRLKTPPKAATYHGLSIDRIGDHLETTIVLDI